MGLVSIDRVLRAVLALTILTGVAEAAPQLYVGARQDDKLVVLAYRPDTGTLRPFGPPLPVKPRPGPTWEDSRFFYLFGNDRHVFVQVEDFEGVHVFGGDGTRWNVIAQTVCGTQLHPHVSADGELIAVCEMGEDGGEHSVKRWDGTVVGSTPTQGELVGFVEQGSSWVIANDPDRFVHAPGGATRKLTTEVVFDELQCGVSKDRYQIADRHTPSDIVDRQSGKTVASFKPAAIAGTDHASPDGVSCALAGPRAALAVHSSYWTHGKSGGGCGNNDRFSTATLDLVIVEAGKSRVERLQQTQAFVGAVVDPTASHAIWIENPTTLGTYDIVKRKRGTLKTRYQLVAIQRDRR